EHHDRFLHVLVDEYQDTNRLQGELTDLLAAGRRNLLVVGDDAQSIYSFRGAEVGHLLAFGERYPDARTYRLERNYRSTPDVVAAGRRPLLVGGDAAKSIYSFRGAEVGPLLALGEPSPDARPYRLERNYRSTPEIVALANRSIAHNRRQHRKHLCAVRAAGQ